MDEAHWDEAESRLNQALTAAEALDDKESVASI